VRDSAPPPPVSDAGTRERRAGEALSRRRIEQRFLANSGLIIAARVATACLSVVTVPVLVARFGVAGYGTWEALLALATLTSILQAAVSGTLVWRVSEAFGSGDLDEIRRLARLGAGVSWTLLVVLWPLAWFLRHPVVIFLGVAPDTRQVAAGMFPVMAAIVLLGGLCETLEAVVSGCQRTGMVNVVTAFAQILNYSVVIVLTLRGGGLWSLVVGQAVGFGVRLGGAWAATRVAYGRVTLVPLLPARSDLMMARYSGLLTVSSVSAALRDQTDKIILASLASPVWVGYYGMASRLSGLVLEILRPLYTPLLTASGALKAMGDWDGVRRLYSRSMTIVSILTGVVVVVVAGLADRLVVLWVGYPIPQVTLLVWLLVIGSATAAMLTGPGTALCRGCGRAGIETTYLAFNLVLNVVFTIVLVAVLGPVGTAVATGTTWALSSVLFVVVLHRGLDLPVGASRRAGGAALLAFATAVGVHLATSLLGLPATRYDALISVTLLGAASGLVYLGLALAFRLASISQAYGGVRSLLQQAGS
jgi:O-antigen/teichoic acid export membrane protein